jgi:UDPglucose 6-dehydrogenase
MNIAVIGTGYVGLVTGACFAEFGINVTCVDKDADKIDRLERGEIPIFEPGLEEIVRRNRLNGRLSFTTDTRAAVQRSLVVFIAVPTPPQPDGSTDLSYVDQVARTIGEHLNGYKVVVTKSTVPVKTAERVKRLISETVAGTERERFRFSVASNPEFLREGSAVEDFMRPDRVVIGADDDEAIAILKDLYNPLYLIETPFVITNVATSELIKYASNAFLATKITFINEVANLCECVGADVHSAVRVRRGGRAQRGARDGARRPDRQEVPASRTRLRRILLPEGHRIDGPVQPGVRRRAEHRRGRLRGEPEAARANGREDRAADR